jgi:glycosyltransferase involved in cell wall biosynthesis
MRILLINHFLPPDLAPTARLLGELGHHLGESGWDVAFVGASNGYHQAGAKGWRRWARDFMAHGRILWRGLTGPKSDWILCLSDPPALVFTCSLLAKLKGARLAHWAMDVYPQIAAALGAIPEESPIYEVVHRLCRRGYDSCAVIGVLDEDMAGALSLQHDSRCLVCPPWPPPDIMWPKEQISPGPGRIRWLYSGNLGRAHEYETLLQAQKQLEDAGAPFDLVLQGGGPSRSPARELQQRLELKHCVWKDYAPDGDLVDSLLRAHVLIATQRSETRGLLWPSKLALMECLPRAVVWVGHPEGEIGKGLRNRTALTGVFAPGDSAELAEWLQSQETAIRFQAAQPFDTPSLAAQLSFVWKQSLESWGRMLKNASATA